MKVFQSKIGLIMLFIFLIVLVIVIINCSGMDCTAVVYYPWLLFPLFQRLSDGLMIIAWVSGGTIQYIYVGLILIIIDSIIIYYIGYALQDLFSKRKLPRSKFLFFLSIITALCYIYFYLFGGPLAWCSLSLCYYYDFKINCLIFSIGLIIGIGLLLLIIKTKIKLYYLFFLNLILALSILSPLLPIDLLCEEKIVNNIDECERIKNTNIKEICFRRLANNKQDLNICDSIKDNYNKTECYFQVFKVKKDLDIDEALTRCSKISNLRCYEILAVNANNLSICDNIIQDEQKYYCYKEVLVAHNSVDYKKYLQLCKKLPFESILNDYKKVECFCDIAIKLNDPTICDNITWYNPTKTRCYQRVRTSNLQKSY